MKKPHGHYCRICGQRKANEKFSGRGHAAHICKACAKRGNRPPEIKAEPLVFVDSDEDRTLDNASVLDIYAIPYTANEEPLKPKKKRKPSKEKLLRAAQKKQAKELLSRLLSDGDTPVKEITNAAREAKIPSEALRRAKGSLGIKAVVTENGNTWRLPNKQGTVAQNEKS